MSRNDSRSTEVYEVRVGGRVAIRTRNEAHAQLAYDAVVAQNQAVEMFVGIEGDGHGPHDFELTDSFAPEQLELAGRDEGNAFEDAIDLAEAMR
jgi:hypothetical protein